MTTEQGKTLEGLQIAIRMEIDGKEYYQKVSQSSGNQLGQRLFQSLADEEDIHQRVFQRIYDGIQNEKAWPGADFRPDRGRRLRTIFAEAAERLGSSIEAPATELDAIQTAMDMENKSYDFYKIRGRSAAYDGEKEFYETVAAEERGHYLTLRDYREYLFNPAGWFVEKEHPSLDGG